MAATVTIKELRRMQKEDLLREVAQQKMLVAKTKMGIHMKKEKDTSKLAKARKTLAHMQTVVSEKTKEEWLSKDKNDKVPASAASKAATSPSKKSS